MTGGLCSVLRIEIAPSCTVALERALVKAPEPRSRDAETCGRESALPTEGTAQRLVPERFGRATNVARLGADLLR